MKNFPTMGVNDLQRLRDHGTGVLRDVEMMVMFVKAEDDEQLIAKIHKVCDLEIPSVGRINCILKDYFRAFF